MLTFEWDDAKADANYRKHGISFEFATRVFGDPFAIEAYDPMSPEHGEERIRIIGRAADLHLTVIYTEREDHIRLISARRATKSEHDHYYHENTKD
jgi:uncharacterized DUF497 family protein